VESTQRQLGSRFTNRLSGYDTYRITFLCHVTGSKVFTVALYAYSAFAFAGKYRTDLDCFNPCLLNFFGNIIIYLFTSGNNNLVS
jgi:hypothetical protein